MTNFIFKHFFGTLIIPRQKIRRIHEIHAFERIAEKRALFRWQEFYQDTNIRYSIKRVVQILLTQIPSRILGNSSRHPVIIISKKPGWLSSDLFSSLKKKAFPQTGKANVARFLAGYSGTWTPCISRSFNVMSQTVFSFLLSPFLLRYARQKPPFTPLSSPSP